MTEAEWLACDDPQRMLKFLRGKASDRKLRLFACACCRLIWHLLADERSRRAVEVAEQFAEGLANAEEREAAEVGADQARKDASEYSISEYLTQAARAACCVVYPTENGQEAIEHAGAILAACSLSARHGASDLGGQVALRGMASYLLRDVFGNPFRPIGTDPGWLTSRVVEQARAIYEDRAFDKVPELADVLKAAGCHNTDILAHCRGPGPHVRGCWVVDLLLGKE